MASTSRRRDGFHMPRPVSRSGTANAQFRRRIPADLVGAVTYRLPVAIKFAATATSKVHEVTAKHGGVELKFSLGTAYPADVRARQGIATDHVERLWSNLRAWQSNAMSLTLKQIVALSGEVYRKFIELHSDEPGSAQRWQQVKALNRAAREHRALPQLPSTRLGFDTADENDNAARMIADGHATITDAINALPVLPDEAQRLASLEHRFGEVVNYVLALHQLVNVDAHSRARLLIQAEAASTDAAKTLKRNAIGDYSDDPASHRFPAVAIVVTPGPSKFGPTWQDLIGACRTHPCSPCRR